MVKVKRENKQVVCGVYCIRNIINNKRYVGSSIDIYGRWTTHIRKLENNKHENDHLQKSWNKYGKDNFEFTILEMCKPDIRFDIEQKWYDFYRSYDYDYGYNIAKIAKCPSAEYGIDEIKNGKSLMSYDQFLQLIHLLTDTAMPLTEVAKNVGISLSVVNSVFYKNSYSELVKDYVFKPREHFKKAKLTIEDVKEIIERLKIGEHPADIAEKYVVKKRAIFAILKHEAWKELTKDIEFPDLQKRRFGHGHNIIKQYDMDGNLVNTYKSTMIAYEETGVSWTAISQVCLGRCKTAGGYVWRYDDDSFDKYSIENEPVKPPSRWNPCPVDQYKDGVYIRTFRSINEAIEITGAKNINAVLNGKYKQSGGFEWRRHVEDKLELEAV